VVETLRTAARIRLLARLGLVLGLLLIVFAVTFAPDRRQAVLDASIGLLSLAAVLALIVPLGRSILGGTVADPTSRAALGDLWTVFAGGLRTWAIGLAAAGLMLLASAAAFLERVRLREVLRRGVAELTNPQLSPGWQALRITIALAVGGFAMVAPLATLTAATVVAGTLLMALAVYELVAMLAPNLGSAAAGSTPRLNPALAIGLTCILLAAGAMGAFTLVLRFRPKVAAAATDAALQCNQSSALCARRLNEITFAGAHNAMGSADRPYWMFPNQDAGISKLLHLGVRAVMLDVWKGYPVGDRIKTDFGSEEQRRKFEAVIGPEAFAAAMRIRDRLVGESGKAGLNMCHGFCELGAAPFD
jgi:hypothetical protein